MVNHHGTTLERLPMKIFFDCEFTGLHQRTTLISLGLVAEDGQTFYAEFDDYDRGQIDEWLKENVLANLCARRGVTYGMQDGICYLEVKGSTEKIKHYLSSWLERFHLIEIWGDTPAYDWVLFCELFGGGVECLPKNVYRYPFDLCTLLKIEGVDPDMDREELSGVKGIKHNALEDAQITKVCYEKLK